MAQVVPLPTTSAEDLDGLTTTVHAFGKRFLEYDLNNMIIDRYALKANCPLSTSYPPGKDYRELYGIFKLLPQEICFKILNYLDIEIICECITLCKDSRSFVDSSPAWRALKDHAPNVLRALLSTGLGSYFTLTELYSTLCKEACFVCHKFGAFIDLLSCQRCCWTCIKTAKELCPITPAYAVGAYGLSEDTMDTIPQMLTLPGHYSVTRKFYKKRTVLLREQAAWDAGVRQHGSEEALKEYMRNSEELFQGDGRKAFRTEWESTPEDLRRELPLPRGPNTLDLQMWNPDRFMSIIEIPSLDIKTGIIEVGVACSACVVAHFYGGERRPNGFDHTVMFTKRGYLDHFKECPKSQKQWAEKFAERSKARKTLTRIPVSILVSEEVATKDTTTSKKSTPERTSPKEATLTKPIPKEGALKETASVLPPQDN